MKMKMRLNKSTLFALLGVIALSSCNDSGTPRPIGYMRIDLPTEEYSPIEMDEDCPYSFDMNTMAEWEKEKRGECWGNINYPSIRAQLQLTYKDVNEDNLEELLNEAHALAYKHTVRADGIQEQLFLDRENKVYGLLFRMRGEAATTTQFFLTDSTEHFLRGVVYFYANPNPDSLKPVDQFMAKEVIHMIESTRWKSKQP